MRPFFVYLLRCADGSYYAGHTDGLDARLQQHQSTDSGYTATRKPVELVWQGEFETREEALAFELQIKGWSRAKKEALISGEWGRIQELSKSKTRTVHPEARPNSAHPEPKPNTVRPELVEGWPGEPRLRQAQPERMGSTEDVVIDTVRPEPVEGSQDEARLRQAQPERMEGATCAANDGSHISPVRPELVEGFQSDARLRQAQPERVGAKTDVVADTVRPEPVEGSQSEARLRQAQPERMGAKADGVLDTVRPEPGEGSQDQARLRQAQPERMGSTADLVIHTVRPEPVEGLQDEARLRQAQPERVEGVPAAALLDGILQANSATQRRAIAKSITLLESTRADHRAQGDELLTALLSHTGKAFRLGISGVPGVGKSTFIEALGLYLIQHGHRVAVLTIDPSSTVSGGSILGDKTRMEMLSVHENAYIRPSPSTGTLGGVAEKTREAMLVCEAAGYDIVMVETVGVGQSETAVASMTDMFVLMQLPNAGDDLQAIKKGVMELADLVVINKADIDAIAAQRAQLQITSAMQLLGMFSGYVESHWHPKAIQVSALNGQGVEGFWQQVLDFKARQTDSGKFAARRKQQSLAWMWERINAGLMQAFRHNPAVNALLPDMLVEVANGRLAPSTAARDLLLAQVQPAQAATN